MGSLGAKKLNIQETLKEQDLLNLEYRSKMRH